MPTSCPPACRLARWYAVTGCGGFVRGQWARTGVTRRVEKTPGDFTFLGWLPPFPVLVVRGGGGERECEEEREKEGKRKEDWINGVLMYE